MVDKPASNPGLQFVSGPASPSRGGPKFGKPKGLKKGQARKISAWLKKHGSSLIVPLIAICILLGGIYLYKNWPTETKMPTEEQIAGLSERVSEPEMTEAPAIPEEGEPPAEAGEAEPITERPQEEPEKTEKIIAQEEGAITVQAKKGEGITHLARQALREYLKDNPELTNKLTKEHKIYIEDYLKDKKVLDRAGNKIVEINEEISFNQDLIKEAIDKSQVLSPEQLKNLEKYSALVHSL